ncbi:unnamed protein product [Ectocarpus sp. CCAP 1310/34]|nr:unnamed protein product [Ectocarpus sp. CCAP 1310/34]
MNTATSNTGVGSAFASDSSTNQATVIKGLKKLDRKDSAEFKTWIKKLCVVLGVTRKDILPLLKKQRKPDPADTRAFDSNTANEDLYAILFLLVEFPAALSVGEPISDRRFKDICVHGFSDEYEDVKLMVFRDPTFNVLDMQPTMRNIFLDEQSRKGWKGRIAGRGFAMATTAAKKKTKPARATKWCSKRNTTSYSDEECYQQGGKRPEDTKDSSKAFTTCSDCTHCSSASNKNDSNNEEAVVDFTGDEDTFDSGFMFATCSRISGRNFAASSTGVGLLVDTGALETMFDNRLIRDGTFTITPSETLRRSLTWPEKANSQTRPRAFYTAPSRTIEESNCACGFRDPSFRGLVETFFRPPPSLKEPGPGLRCVVEESTPHLTIQGKVIPLAQDPRDQSMCTPDITFEQNVQPSGTRSLVPHQKQSQTHTANAVCFTLVNADTWHRRLGHLNARSLDILRKDTGTGVDYRDSLSPCAVFQIAKDKQSSHPKQSTRDLSRPGQLVVIDNMGPVNPPAKYKGGYFPYACKITDDYTKMKEVYLLRKKSDTTEAVHTYNMCVAAARGYRIETIRCDKRSENTGSEFRDYCENLALKLEYAATNTPHQIGVSERDEQTLAGGTRCLLKDGDFRRPCGGS